MKTLRVLTYNVHAGKKIDRIIDWLNRIPDTDVICLQEFPKEKIDEMSRLLGRISYGYIFAPAFTIMNNVFGELTMYRKDRLRDVRSEIVILDINKIERRIIGTTIPRSFLIVRGKIGGKKIAIINVHIVALATNTTKYSQVSQIMKRLDEIESPLLMLGDFNISSVLGKRKLIQLLKESGYAMHPKKISTHRVGIFRHQFDYLFAKNCTILEQSSEVVKFSDHFPVRALCEF